MTFTRELDGAVLNPLAVVGPFEQGRTSNNRIREVMQSSAVRVTYNTVTHRHGYFELVFASYNLARLATNYFSRESLYTFEGPPLTAGGYAIVDGYIVASDGTYDAGFSVLFAVDDGDMTINQTAAPGAWTLRVPYKEVTP